MKQALAERLVDLALARGKSAYAMQTSPSRHAWIFFVSEDGDHRYVKYDNETLITELWWLDLPEINT